MKKNKKNYTQRDFRMGQIGSTSLFWLALVDSKLSSLHFAATQQFSAFNDAHGPKG